MGRDTSTIEGETNGVEEVVKYKIITENELLNHKLDIIIKLLTPVEEKVKTEENSK
jgi:hypothetical protein